MRAREDQAWPVERGKLYGAKRHGATKNRDDDQSAEKPQRGLSMASISLTIRILDKDYQVNCQARMSAMRLSLSAKLLGEKMEEIRRGSHISSALNASPLWPRSIWPTT